MISRQNPEEVLDLSQASLRFKGTKKISHEVFIHKEEKMKKPFMLMILDGFGLSSKTTGNAIAAASLPNINEMFKKYPFTTLKASGLAVGLPEGQMGNSEVGHLNIGAGRVVYQELTRISKAIDEGIFNGNTALLSAINHAGSCKTLHIMGLRCV